MDSYWAHNFGDRGLNPHDLSHQVTIGASAETQWQQQERGIAELVRWNMKPWGFPCWLVVEPYPSENIFPTEWKIIIQSCSSHHQAAKPWGFPLFWSNESMNLQIFPHFHISPGRFSRLLQSPGLVSSFQPSRRRSFFQCPQQSSRDPGGMAPWRELSGIFFCIFFCADLFRSSEMHIRLHLSDFDTPSGCMQHSASIIFIHNQYEFDSVHVDLQDMMLTTLQNISNHFSVCAQEFLKDDTSPTYCPQKTGIKYVSLLHHPKPNGFRNFQLPTDLNTSVNKSKCWYINR